MKIKKIKLQNFRNYINQEIDLYDGINIFYGENAQGKTNILEAIFVCAMGKSFRTNKDKELICFNKENLLLQVEYERIDRFGKINIEISDKKSVYLNNIKIKKLSEILGKINIVIFSPNDIEIFKRGPAERRKFLNMMISSLKPKYVYILNLYLKVLEQRNNYLKKIKYDKIDNNLIEIWDEKLSEYGFIIYKYRLEFINKIINKINKIHSKITNNKEEIKINYISDLKNRENYLQNLKKCIKIDILKGYTTTGVQRDDFEVYINNKKIKIFGSQGQHRTVVLSLKLAELEIIFDEIGEYPILLLDDFMSELDFVRINNFLKNMKNTQILITCTEKINLNNLNYNLFNVNSGVCEEVSF